MNKKIILLLLIIFPILFVCFTENAKADDTYIYFWYFKTNKQKYYTDETIVINGSWSMDHSDGVACFMQIRIFNETGNMLWNSDWYIEKSPYPEKFNVTLFVQVRDLFIPAIVSEYVLYVRFLYIKDYLEDYMREIPITITKRNCSCELFNFKNNIDVNINNCIIFSATFYNESKYLANQLVNIQINNISISKLTNTNGSIELELRFPNNLTLGKNILLLNVINDKFLRQRTFEYNIIVDQNFSINNSDNEEDKDGDKEEEKDGDKDSTFQFNAFSFSLIFFISILIMFSIYYTNKKKIKQQKIADITFRN